MSNRDPATIGMTPGAKLRVLLERPQPLPVLGLPSARTAQMMERYGAEAGFVGTQITVGNYTGMPDVGIASSTECTTIGGWVARAVSFPVILDGDTGHGGPAAVKRFVRDAIREGLAGVRLDDQPLEEKRRTRSTGLHVVDREHAIARYRAAVEARDDYDPGFVIVSQCYARDADNGGLDETRDRVRLYGDEGGVDWVQIDAPHSVEEIRLLRLDCSVYFSAMQGHLDDPMDLEQHAELGLDAAWYTFVPQRVLLKVGEDFLADFQQRGIQAWIDYSGSRQARVAEDI
jgi:methylisocitrate lyase